MTKEDFHVRAMKYFTENIDLFELWKIVKECTNEFCYISFDDIISGEIDLPSVDEIKKHIADKVPYDFESSGLADHGPFNLSGMGDDNLYETLDEVESVYKKFHDALTLVVAKSVKNSIHQLIENVKKEVNQLRKKYLS